MYVHGKLILKMSNLLILGSRCKVKYGPRAVKNRTDHREMVTFLDLLCENSSDRIIVLIS